MIVQLAPGIIRLDSGFVGHYCICSFDDSSDDDREIPTAEELDPLCPCHTEAGKAALLKFKNEQLEVTSGLA